MLEINITSVLKRSSVIHCLEARTCLKLLSEVQHRYITSVLRCSSVHSVGESLKFLWETQQGNITSALKCSYVHSVEARAC